LGTHSILGLGADEPTKLRIKEEGRKKKTLMERWTKLHRQISDREKNRKFGGRT